ncbi:MAG TPA: glycosyltransferase family 39 protein [Candidatus Hydrogenedentes bacterium]|nr:glycosyltransferase family 39 protein [Candidatus Hydrogenedentota bacterium]
MVTKRKKTIPHKTQGEKDVSSLFRNPWPWIALFLIVALTAAARIRTLDVPFERDEGEYAYAGQLLLQGVPPFSEAYNMKMPGIYAAYAAIMAAFGQTIRGVHLGLLVINAATIALMFLLGRRVRGPVCGLASAAAYAALSLSEGVMGLFAHATHFVVLFAVAGLVALLLAVEKPRVWLCAASGLLFGLSFLMKQHAAPIILFAGLCLAWSLFRQKTISRGRAIGAMVAFGGAAIAPFLLTCLWLYAAGVFDRFWFWTYDYARTYVSQVPIRYAAPMFWDGFQKILKTTWPLWILATAGLFALAWDKASRSQALFVTGLWVASFLAICPGFYFRGHYFVTWLPATALLAGVFFAAAQDLLSKRPAPALHATAVVLAIAVSALTAYWQRAALFTAPLDDVSRAMYSVNPFPESLRIARYIRERTSESDCVAIIGSEPQICFYSHRRNATGYVYMYPLMEAQPYAASMQREMIRQIEEANPKFAVFVNVPTSWLVQENSILDILSWSQKYLESRYQVCGMADIAPHGETTYLWGEEAESRRPHSPYWVAVLERKEGVEPPQ